MSEFSGFAPMLTLVIVVLAATYVVQRLRRDWRAAQITVDDTQTALLVRKGVVTDILRPGRYSTWMKRDDRIDLFDIREQSVHVAGQEVLSADLMPVKLSVILRFRIADARAYRAAGIHPPTVIYEDAQVMLRERTAALSLDALLADRGRLLDGLPAALDSIARPLGMEVTGVALRDLTLAGPAKQAFADLWKSQKDGQAALERARGEQASLRSLANAARMLKGNPELMNLRLLQALSGGPGRPAPTVVLGGGAGLLPVQGGDDSQETGTSTPEG